MYDACDYDLEKGTFIIYQAMKMTHHEVGEQDIEIEMEYVCRMAGASGLAFVPVVAGASSNK